VQLEFGARAGGLARAEPWCRDGVLLSTTKQNDVAAFSLALGNTSHTASHPG